MRYWVLENSVLAPGEQKVASVFLQVGLSRSAVDSSVARSNIYIAAYLPRPHRHSHGAAIFKLIIVLAKHVSQLSCLRLMIMN